MTARSHLQALQILLFLTVCSFRAEAQRVTDAVNPFIGTAGGGNTFPGAILPWGMVSVSPHTAPGSPAGYLHGQRTFYGFGHTHLSGTGCADFGSIVVIPQRGEFRPGMQSQGTSFSHEWASPGYYSMSLDDLLLDAEVSATLRCGVTRFRAAVPGKLTVVLDVGASLGLVGGGSVTVVSDKEVEGFNIGGGMCGELNRHRTYFVARFSSRAHSRGAWKGEDVVSPGKVEGEGAPLGAWLGFDVGPDKPLMVKVGISYVSIANARMNLEREMPDWDFDRVRAEALAAWEEQLSRIHVTGGRPEDAVKFYTALYHALIHPSIASDVNGQYMRMGGGGTDQYGERQRYSVFSLWDTYRTLHPLLTLVYPEIQTSMIRTMVDMARESGWLPKWELAANETYLMVGDPAAIVIADSYGKGLQDFDVVMALRAIEKAASPLPDGTAPPIRPGYHDYLRLGYIPADQDTTQQWWVWGPVSTMLEYCLADWAVGRMAEACGDTGRSREYARRAAFYRNVFDTGTGLLRPRRSDGSWLTPFDPLATEGSGSWQGAGGPGYVEGNAWNYTWFVPHDIGGLMSLFGGPEPFAAKLTQGFSLGHFSMTNEPDIGHPYVYRITPGYERQTEGVLHTIMESDYGTGPDGLPGNDDAGTMSAWYVFSALGVYPFCPGSGSYIIGRPVFDSVRITLHPGFHAGKEIVIEKMLRAKGAAGTSVWFQGKELESYVIGHRELTGGGRLVIGVPEGG